MSKWKCEICNSEFENFHAQGFDSKIYCPLCYFKKLNNDKDKEIERLNKEKDDLDDYNRHLYNENKRLNNNWNKLENYIEDKRDYYDNQDYAYYMFNQVLEYLKELKEGK